MLTALLTLLENKENGLSLAEISRALDAQPSAVVSMLKLLVQKGRLAEIGPDGKCCEACGVQAGCNLLAARGKRYACVSPAFIVDTLNNNCVTPAQNRRRRVTRQTPPGSHACMRSVQAMTLVKRKFEFLDRYKEKQ